MYFFPEINPGMLLRKDNLHMNETIKVIMNRRSHRKYKADQIDEEKLQAIMECAIHAPSGMNQQKWHFTVIQNKNIIDEMVKRAKENLKNSDIEFLAKRAEDPAFNLYYYAPTVVVITVDEKAPFTEIDCGAAAENIALAAESFNIGSCLIAMSGFIFQGEGVEELKKQLGIPENYRHVISVALGYKENENQLVPPKNTDVINYIR
jgi:nitroreductase